MNIITTTNPQLSSILKRFQTLYPRLLKNQHSAYHGPPKPLSVHDQIKLCKSLAKSESIALITEESKQNIDTLKALEIEVAQIMQNDLDFSLGQGSQQLFSIFLYMYAQYKAPQPAKGFLDLIFEIFKKAQLHVVNRRKGHSVKEEAKQVIAPTDEENLATEVNFDIDISLKNDDKLQSLLEVIANIMRKLIRLGEEPVLALLNIIEQQIVNYIQVQTGQVLNLDLFAPTSIVYKLLEMLISNDKLKFTQPVTHRFERLLELTFSLFDIYKANSQYFIITIHSSSQQKDSEEKQVRRMSVLFTDLLDMLVAFCCQHLKSLVKLGSQQHTQQSFKLYQCLFTGQGESTEYFTLRERLRILNELNSIFNRIPEIVSVDYYWGMIRDGLYDLDPYCRKVSMAVLKSNLKALAQDGKLYQGVQSKAEFEQMWTTFFDLYDTLESFGSHLTKAVWERTELIYAFIAKFYGDPSLRLHPLVDFREWLMVLYKRVQNHMNLKLRRYVQKSTLKRKYMTKHMSDYVFDGFLKALNKGLIFKDSNIYTQFSLKAELVNEFYQAYFTKECVDLSRDLSRFFRAFHRNVSHPQLMMCTMRNLARDYPSQRGIQPIEGYIGNEEIALLFEMTTSFFNEQIYSNKYLCWKYMLQMLSLYTKANSEINYTVLLKLIGKMPIEFFSNQAFSDREGQQYARVLVQRFGEKNVVENLISGFINDLFQVKAIVQQMPKFGNEIDLLIQGIARLVLILALSKQQGEVSDPNSHAWFRDIMRPNWDSIQQIFSSSYLSPEVLDSKVRYLSVLFSTLYKYGDDGLKQALRQDLIPRTLHLVLERLENNLLVPLSKYEQVQHQPSEMSKVFSLFADLSYYLKYLEISITACHIHMNQANSALEKTIKLILQMALKIQGKASEKVQDNVWTNFLTQYVVTRTLRVLTKCYASGIRKSLQKGITQLTVAEDIFSFGKPLLQGLVEFRQIPRPKESEEEISGEQKRFLIDNNLNLTQMQQEVLLNQWKTLSELLQIFHFEKQSREELLIGMYPLIAQTAQEFLMSSTRPYLSSLYRVLKNTYIPVLIERLKTAQDGGSQLMQDYHYTIQQCWSIIKELQTEFDPSSLQEFMEFAFHAELMTLANSLPVAEECQSFYDKMAADIFEQGNKYWLIMRTAFNHIMFTVSHRPTLLPQFVSHIANFATCREVRSLDSEILLYRMNTLIPQIVPKSWENLNMEEITYQGAYIRTLTMIIIEEMINRQKRHVLAGGEIDDTVIAFTEGIERFIINLLDLNYTIKYEKASMPFSDGHRMKVRAWQTIVVLLEYIDPVKSIYNQAFRQARQQHTGEDFIQIVNKHLWKSIGMNHLPSIRSYIEIVMVRFALMYPQYSVEDPTFVRTLLDPNIKANVASSHLTIAGFVMMKLSSHTHLVLKQRLLEHMSGFLTSNGAHVRCVAQYFVHSVTQKDPQIKAMLPSGILPLINYLIQNKDTQKVIARYEEEIARMDSILDKSSQGGVVVVLSIPIDVQGEFLSKPFVEKIKELTTEMMTDMRRSGGNVHPVKRENQWMEALKQRQAEGNFNLQINEESQSNYQRKILPWEQVEYDHELLKRVYENRERNEIIMCAALIDKIPNLAGLARTSEIMNANALVINNKSVVELEEFKGVSVTSEKWLPIYEVQEIYLYKYLLYMKSNGYKILGLEQTANSKMLNEYKFPKKCVMLLGKEKEGIPQEYLSILDECIEIPQFGIIRSLNVHVSGALCLWEYTKQNLPVTSSSKRE